jgi:hypothetical protein
LQNSFTLSAWINAGTVEDDYQTILDKEDATGASNDRNFWLTLWTDGTLHLRFSSNSSVSDCDVADTTDLKNKGWQLVTGVYNGTSCLLYVNGTFRTSDTTLGTPQGVGDALWIGNEVGATTREFNGSIDEVLIFNRSLSQQEILSLYDASANQYYNNFTNLEVGTHIFRGYAVDTAGNKNQTEQRTVRVLSTEEAISISLSPKLSQQINWSFASLPIFNQSAEGNRLDGVTDYYVNISTLGSSVDLYIRANDNLMTSNLDMLGIGNETLSYNLTNNLVPSIGKFRLTTNYSDNQIGSGLIDGSVVYLKFFINAPQGQPAGTYNNSILFKAVTHGQTP